MTALSTSGMIEIDPESEALLKKASFLLVPRAPLEAESSFNIEKSERPPFLQPNTEGGAFSINPMKPACSPRMRALLIPANSPASIFEVSRNSVIYILSSKSFNKSGSCIAIKIFLSGSAAASDAIYYIIYKEIEKK